jgi:phosphoribosylaminoimidazole-succinocarboxamide synthase
VWQKNLKNILNFARDDLIDIRRIILYIKGGGYKTMELKVYEGKSKIVKETADHKNCVIEFKDTATANNGEKKEELEGKGKLNAAISNIIFQYLTAKGIKNHLVTVMDETHIMVKNAQIIPVEVIVRNVAAGGFSKKYGVEEGTALSNTVVEFCLKDDILGDPMMNETQITAIGLALKNELKIMTASALKINKLLKALLLKAGIRLIDFKVEFGRVEGKIILCDEISPDSCRFWDAETNEKMDKDRFRRDLGGVIEGYQDVLDRIKSVQGRK